VKQSRTLTEEVQKRWSSLDSEASGWTTQWQDLSRVLFPRAGRFYASDANKGQDRFNNILDRTGTGALRILAAGMMSGVTSPARPWFRLATPDPSLMDYQPVKEWLADVQRAMQRMFARSNTYRALHSMYEELGAFGTADCSVLDNFDRGIHLYQNTVGRYRLACNYEGTVDTSYRKFQKTVRQMVDEFGYSACSITVRNLYDACNYEAGVTVIHGVEPRTERDATKMDARNMPWRSVYIEEGCDKNQVLRESGFRRYRNLSPRWYTTSEDVYGQSPGMEVMGDLNQLQHEQLRKSQGIDYQTRPPMQGPSSAKNHEIDFLPGGMSFVDTGGPSGGLRPSFESRIDLNHLLMDIADVRQRINSGMYSDLFLMVSNSANTNMTATEVAERHEEKLLMLGPVLERLHNELLDPLIEMAFERLIESGQLPPPPPELQGASLDVEFVSILAQAQRAIGANSTDRFIGNLGAVAQIKPEVLDKFDADAWVDAYSDQLGVDPDLIVDSREVALVRQQRAQKQAQAEQMAQAQQAAETAAKLGTVQTQTGNAGGDLMNQLTGYGSPAPYAY